MLQLDTLILSLGFTEQDKNELLDFYGDDATSGILSYASASFENDDLETLTDKCVADTLYAKAALLAFLLKALSAWEEYEQKGISFEIFTETMSDLRVWAYNYKRERGSLGISELLWLHGFVVLGRFKLGRLQFNKIKYEKTSAHNEISGLKDGDNMLEVHIQQDGPFTDELCSESFAKAKAFFAEYYPEYQYKGFICHSWLLSPGLMQVLPESSNIIKFGKRFTVVEYEKENDSQAIERLFEERFKNEPQKMTSLQKKAKELLDNGGHLGIALGVII